MGKTDDQWGALGGCLVQVGLGVVEFLSGAQGDLWSCLSAFILGVWLLVLCDLGHKPGTQ